MRAYREETTEMADAGAGVIDVAPGTSQTLITLRGEIDLRCTDDLEQAGQFAIDTTRPATMDVTEVTMIDSVGISFVVRLAAAIATAGNILTLRGPNPRVAELITILGADELIHWSPPGDAVRET